MIGIYTRRIIIILLITAGFIHLCVGQTIVIDTSNFIKKLNLEEPNRKNDTSKRKYFSGDFIFMPQELLKNDKWDTLNVRTRSSESRSKDSATIVLKNPNENPFVYPYKGKVISPFGFRGHRIHAGIDIKLKHNDTVLCAFDGVVRMARTYGGYGNAVVVRHFNGLETLYGHLAKISVRVNEEVRAGDLIGYGGRTGRATTDHLHFETRYQGEPFNPERILDVVNHTLLIDTLFLSHSSFNKSGKAGTDDENKVLVLKSDRKHKSKKQSLALAAKEKKNFHRIRKGETLSEIANKYGITTTELCHLNGFKKNKLLQLGIKLRVS